MFWIREFTVWTACARFPSQVLYYQFARPKFWHFYRYACVVISRHISNCETVGGSPFTETNGFWDTHPSLPIISIPYFFSFVKSKIKRIADATTSAIPKRLIWCWQKDLNFQSTLYKSVALPFGYTSNAVRI